MAASARPLGSSGPVVVFSSDPSLITAMQATLGSSRAVLRRVQAPGSVDWPSGSSVTVVLDVAPELRRSAYDEVRRRHRGRLVLIAEAGERADSLPPDAARFTITRPFAIAELLDALSAPLPEEAAAVPVSSAGDAPGLTGRDRLGAWADRLHAWWDVLAERPTRTMLVAGGAVLLLLAAWFSLGLLRSAADLNRTARATRTELSRVDTALAAADPGAARNALQVAQGHLDGAKAAADRRPVRLAARLPVLSATVDDLRRLLRAAQRGTRAAGLGVALYEQADSDRPATAMFRDQRVDLAALARMRRQADSLLGELAAAQTELRAVRGGVLAPGVAGARASGLRQVEQLSDRVRSLMPALEALPAALGGDRPRTYLVVLTTPAELRPSGGTPLAAVRVRVDGGRIEIQERDVGVSLHHAAVRWTAAPGDPWSAAGRFDDFSLANSSPHFPTSGEELLRAYRALTGMRPDGVVAVDPLAMRALLRATGPVEVPAYGQVTAGNVSRLTMRGAYDRWPEASERRRYNQQLVGAVLRRFLDGRLLLEKLDALGTEAAERHLQVYAADPAVQAVLGRSGLDGALAPVAHDYLAAYTANTNASRVDYFQRRSIGQRVELRPDGSASVTRTIRVQNRAPVSGALDPGQRTGYTSPHSTATVATYLPPGARLGAVQADGRPVRAAVAEEAGRPFLRVATELAPGRAVTVTVAYLAPPRGRLGDPMTYELAADPQPMVEPPRLQIEVVAPEGMTIRPDPGWTVQGSTARTALTFSRTISSRLEVHRQ
jgi:hypothetical protein